MHDVRVETTRTGVVVIARTTARADALAASADGAMPVALADASRASKAAVSGTLARASVIVAGDAAALAWLDDLVQRGLGLRAPVLALTDEDETAPAPVSARTGVRIAGVLPAGAPAGQVVAAIAAIRAGLRVHAAPAAPAPATIDRAARPLDEIEAEPLTGRERDVLALVALGARNRAIARQLGISEHTVKFHVASILGKLGVATRTEAAREAMRRGLVTM